MKLGQIQKDIYRNTFEVLNDALNKGYAANTKYDTEDKKFIDQLRHNLAVFSAFKSYRQSNELITSLLDKEGKAKSWNQYRKDTQAIDKTYNSQWLQAEFNLAQRQARSAEQWRDFVRDEAVYPNLEYMASRAAKQRDSHKSWYGVIKPINDAFWDTAFPPNGWGCKCWARQSDAEPTSKEVEPPKEIKGISGNAGKTAQIFSASHGYLQNLSKEDKNNVASEMKRMNVPSAEDLTKRRIEFEAFGKEYEKTYFDDLTGGYVVSHVKVEKKSDYKDIKAICVEFAKQGNPVQITPRIHFKDPLYKVIYKELMGTKYEKKCPDFKVGNYFYEYEGFETKNTSKAINNMLSRGLKQSDKLVIQDDGSTINHIKKLINFHSDNNNYVSEVFVFRIDGSLELVYKKQNP